MDFVARHPALKQDTAGARRFAEIYQQLGLAWEFLALQCTHCGSWRKLRDGKSACKICGTIRGVKDPWLLLPRVGKIVSELPRKLLKKFPVMLQFDKRRRFTGLVTFKPDQKTK